MKHLSDSLHPQIRTAYDTGDWNIPSPTISLDKILTSLVTLVQCTALITAAILLGACICASIRYQILQARRSQAIAAARRAQDRRRSSVVAEGCSQESAIRTPRSPLGSRDEQAVV